MLKSAIAFVILVSIIITSQAQDYEYESWCRISCRASDPFSSNNVLKVRTRGGDGGIIIDLQWHETEFILAMLFDNPVGITLTVIEYGLGHSFIEGEISITGDKSLKIDNSFRQLQLLSDTIVVGTSDGRLMLWDLWREEFLYELAIGEGEISELLAHPSGDWLLAVVDHSKLYRFDLASQILQEVSLPGSSRSTLSAIAFSDNGDLLAVAGKDFVEIWDTESWQALASSELHFKPATKLLFAEDASQLIKLSGATVSRWSLSDNALNYERQLEPVVGKRECAINDGEISLDGTLLLTIDECSQFRAWDLAADAEINLPHFGSADENYQGRELEFSPDGRYLLVAYTHSIEGEFAGFWSLYIVEDQSKLESKQ